MNQEKKIQNAEEITSELLSSSDVVYASEEQEFFYKSTDDPVPYGEPVGLDVPIYNFDYLKHEVDEHDNSRDASKWRSYASEEYEALLKDQLSPKEIKLVLFKDIYWKPSYDCEKE